VVGAFLVLTSSSLGALAVRQSIDPEEPDLVVFHGDGCPHCARELEFLEGLQQRWPDLRIESYEVWHDEGNESLFRRYASAHGIDPSGVPTTFLAGRVWVGFSESTGESIEAAVRSLRAGVEPEPESPGAVDVPGIGTVDLGSRSLLVATVLIGFADGLNPCSLWALSILLALVLHSGSRSRVLVVGSTFLVVTSALYGTYMIGAYSALDYASEMTWIRSIVAAVAGTFGLIQLRSYLTDSRSPLSISEERKPSLYRRMRTLADPDRSLPAVIGGTVVLAAGVSLLETPCTAGLPLLWTDMLADRNVSTGAAILLFSVYLAVFLLDELALFLVVVLTLQATKLQEHHGRALHLIGGSLMTTLAATMLLAPEYLESVGGTFVVLGAAGLLAALLWAIRGASEGRFASQ
jgi:glutaredoxin